MSNKKQRMQNRANYVRLMRSIPSGRYCPNCKQPLNYLDGHFVPPSFGCEGFYCCKKADETAPFEGLLKEGNARVVHVLKTTCTEGEHKWDGTPYVSEDGLESGATCSKCGMPFGHYALHTFD